MTECFFSGSLFATYVIAFSAVGPQGTLLDVEFAIVWRGLEIDQVGVGVGLEPLELGHQHPPAALLLLLDLVRRVELVL